MAGGCNAAAPAASDSTRGHYKRICFCSFAVTCSITFLPSPANDYCFALQVFSPGPSWGRGTTPTAISGEKTPRGTTVQPPQHLQSSGWVLTCAQRGVIPVCIPSKARRQDAKPCSQFLPLAKHFTTQQRAKNVQNLYDGELLVMWNRDQSEIAVVWSSPTLSSYLLAKSWCTQLEIFSMFLKLL